ncbi:MAG: UPF0175 family protein [Cyanobacteria bacterium J06621_3]
MSLVIPEEIVKASQMTEQDMKLEIAVMLYQLGKISSDKVQAWTGLSITDFRQMLAKRQLSTSYNSIDLMQGAQSLQADKDQLNTDNPLRGSVTFEHDIISPIDVSWDAQA